MPFQSDLHHHPIYQMSREYMNILLIIHMVIMHNTYVWCPSTKMFCIIIHKTTHLSVYLVHNQSMHNLHTPWVHRPIPPTHFPVTVPYPKYILWTTKSHYTILSSRSKPTVHENAARHNIVPSEPPVSPQSNVATSLNDPFHTTDLQKPPKAIIYHHPSNPYAPTPQGLGSSATGGSGGSSGVNTSFATIRGRQAPNKRFLFSAIKLLLLLLLESLSDSPQSMLGQKLFTGGDLPWVLLVHMCSPRSIQSRPSWIWIALFSF